ncbi:MAG: glycosyltransferase family 4 protein [Chthoniobacterales bacterium]|nr:glycosyltransferase family 4 protein [Chthoniobacterales bacterium]
MSRIILGLPSWGVHREVSFAERLVRGLEARGEDARVLLTESGCRLVDGIDEELSVPCDIPCDRLPAGPDDTLGQRWEALQRYLEERGPCFYLMLGDQRNNIIAPRLSRNVKLIGVLLVDDEAEIEQVGRLGHFWAAIVASSTPIHFKLASRFPHLAPRLCMIRDEPAMADAYLDLFGRISELEARGGCPRPRHYIGPLVSLAKKVSTAEDDLEEGRFYVNKHGHWPDGPVACEQLIAPVPEWTGQLEDCRIIVAASAETISGVDVFGSRLVRGLRQRGIDARLHGPAPSKATSPLETSSDLPFETRDPRLEWDFISYKDRFRLAVEQIESFAPCIYVPDYNLEWSCICPQLSGRVRVVGIGHSDDPWHYENLCRIGHACDAIVGVSGAITAHLRAIAPKFSGKLRTIPYGVSLPEEPAESLAAIRRERKPDAPLRIAYTGRLVLHQKRAVDLLAIARELDRRGVPFELAIVGDGELRAEMEAAAADLIIRQKLWFAGPQPNAAVLKFLESRDAYLLPSSFEGLSVGMLEAMSHGVVPVVSDIRSGVPDAIVPGKSGLVAPAGDAAAFADRLEWLWRNPAARMKMSAAAARTVADNFSLERMIDSYVEIFSRILAEPSRRSFGPFAPPAHIAREMTWSAWLSRVASDPLASVQRVSQRLLRSGG